MVRKIRQSIRPASCLRIGAALALLGSALAVPAFASGKPDILLITVDTLRYDRLSAYGYERPTSPNIDALLASGARFEQARVPEPLTAPSMVSMVTSAYPHDHATSRNGLPMRQRMISFPKMLRRNGYETAAFVGNWTLKDKISGLAEHFDHYNEAFSRKRWFGLVGGEATADDITEEALEWIEDRDSEKPFLLWVHYVEPHAPYRLHKEFAERLGIVLRENVDPSDRYDTEIAFVDRSIGHLLDGVAAALPAAPLILFMGDHGESLGEHNYWGHGRHLYDVNLRVPFGLTWKGRIRPSTIDALASGLDVGPTLLGLTGIEVPEPFEGYDWSAVLLGTLDAAGLAGRTTFHQAHKGVKKGGEKARRKGLLEVAVVQSGRKEIFRVKNDVRWFFDLLGDPDEAASEVERKSELSPRLAAWLDTVREGLVRADEIPVLDLDDESMDHLRALGYVE